MRRYFIVLSALCLSVAGILAMSGVALAAPSGGTDFVCPVISSDAVGDHNPIAKPLGDTGTYTVVPATSQASGLNVPDQATNMDGAGVPGGPQSAPGDTDYTAIWNGQ